MVTAKELLAQEVGDSTDNNVFIINGDLRTIQIPKNVTNLGVESDDEVLTLQFKMPSTYCGIDLSNFKIRINYLNAKAEGDAYEVTDLTKVEDYMTFSWVVGRHAAQYRGNVKFNVCLKEVVDGEVTREFNTTIATLPVLEGLEVSEQVISRYGDILEQWYAQLFGTGDTVEAEIITTAERTMQEVSSFVESQMQSINNKTVVVSKTIKETLDDVLASIPDDYTEFTRNTNNAIKTRANAITKTEEGSTIRINDGANEYISGLILYGRSEQKVSAEGEAPAPNPDYPKTVYGITNSNSVVYGKNLLKPMGYTYGGYTATVNADGSVTVTGSAASRDPIGLSLATTSTNQPLRLHKNVTYNMWGESDNNVSIYIKTDNDDDEYVISTTSTWNENNGTDYMNIAEVYIESSGQPVGDTTLCGTYRFQLEVGDEFTGFEAYKDPTSIYTDYEMRTLHGIPVEEGGNYTDPDGQQWICDEVDLKRGVYIQRIGVKIFDGRNASWSTVPASGENGTMCTTSVSDVDDNYPALCNRYIYDENAALLGNTRMFKISGTDVFFNTETIGDKYDWVPKLEEWSATNPLTIVYVLTTPIETPLSLNEISTFGEARTTHPTTTIVLRGNVGSILNEPVNGVVTYNVATQTWVDSAINTALASGYSKTLLWRNESPYDKFPYTQNITMPLDSYDAVEIVYMNYPLATATRFASTGEQPVIENFTTTVVLGDAATNSTYISITKSGISFKLDDRETNVPYIIHGIKY